MNKVEEEDQVVKTNDWPESAERMLSIARLNIDELSTRRPGLDFSSARALLNEGLGFQTRAPKRAYEKFNEAADEAMDIPKRNFLGRLWKRADEIRPHIEEWRRAYTQYATFEVLLGELQQIFNAAIQTLPTVLLDLEQSFERRLEFILEMAEKEAEILRIRGVPPRSRKTLSEKRGSDRVSSTRTRGPGRYARAH